MRNPEDVGHFPDLRRPDLRFKLWLGGFGLLALPIVGYLLLMLVVSLMYRSLEGDESIPEDQARRVLTKLLKDLHGVVLDPEFEVVAARRTSGGFQGDGTNWYLVQLPPGRAGRLEADFLAGGGEGPRTRVDAGSIDKSITKALGWRSGPPPDVRAYRFDDRSQTHAIFFDDKFYYRFDHY